MVCKLCIDRLHEQEGVSNAGPEGSGWKGGGEGGMIPLGMKAN